MLHTTITTTTHTIKTETLESIIGLDAVMPEQASPPLKLH